jgi:D-alanyl-D-alanine carboxypeptidase
MADTAESIQAVAAGTKEGAIDGLVKSFGSLSEAIHAMLRLLGQEATASPQSAFEKAKAKWHFTERAEKRVQSVRQRDANKFSNNVMARQLLLQMAAERGGGPAKPALGARVLTDWLSARGIALPDLIVENGSGLSRVERISADSLATLLMSAAADASLSSIFIDSLPKAGIDGTMKRRLLNEPVTGQASIKTGSANEVRSMAGYVNAASGRRWAVVMIVNGPGAHASTAAQDRLLRWMHATL